MGFAGALTIRYIGQPTLETVLPVVAATVLLTWYALAQLAGEALAAPVSMGLASAAFVATALPTQLILSLTLGTLGLSILLGIWKSPRTT